MSSVYMLFFFFFQAEDGIRDVAVTGVQTCALPICGDIRLTEAGLQFTREDTDDRKKLFARHLITYVPLAAHVRRVLDERASHTAPKSRFFDELEDYMAGEGAEQTPRTLINLGRDGGGLTSPRHPPGFRPA